MQPSLADTARPCTKWNETRFFEIASDGEQMAGSPRLSSVMFPVELAADTQTKAREPAELF